MAGNGIDIAKLPLPKLTQLKQQLDGEIDLLTTSLQQLKLAQQKFQESGECVDKLLEEEQNKKVLVPLTDSMYVPGELVDTTKVMIDIGTGYFVEKDVAAAKDYFARKTKYVTTKMESLQTLAKEKLFVRDAVIEVLETKVQAELQQAVANAEAAASKS